MKNVTKIKHAGMLRVFVVAALVLLFAVAGVGAVSADGNVAKIGETGYATLQGAFDAANTNDVIIMLKNTELSSPVNTNGKIVSFDMDGKTITVTESGTRAIEVYGGELTIFGNGKFLRESSTGDNAAILNIYYGGKLIINSGHFESANTILAVATGGVATINSATMIAKDGGTCGLATGNGAVINVYGVSYGCDPHDPDGPGSFWALDGGVVNIYGGTFKATMLVDADVPGETEGANYCLYDYYDVVSLGYIPGEVHVYGGTFIEYDPASSYPPKGEEKHSFVAEGYVSKKLPTEDTWIVYSETEQPYSVAKIDDKYFCTLAGAIDAVEDGQTIELLKDLTFSTPLDITNGKEFTIDLKGLTITGRTNLKHGVLTLKNGKITAPKDAQPLNVYGSASEATGYSVLNIENDVEVTGDKFGICLFGPTYDAAVGYGAVINLKGTVSVTNNARGEGAIFVSGNLDETGTGLVNTNIVNITSGAKVYGVNEPGIVLNGAATVNVENGAEVSGYDGITVKSGILNVAGGKITGAGEYINPVQGNGNGAECSGSAITVSSYYSANSPITVKISGGELKSTHSHAFLQTHSYNSNVQTKFTNKITTEITGGSFLAETKTVSVVEIEERKTDNPADPADYTTKIITGGIFSAKPDDKYVVSGYCSAANSDKTTKATYPYAVLKEFTVTFMNGDSVHDTQMVPEKGLAHIPSVPTNSTLCSALLGWFTDATAGEKYDFSTPVEKDITLYTHWGISHTAEKVLGKAATCTKDGLTDGEKCSVCSAVIVPQKTIEATGHQYSGEKVKIVTKEPTYSEEGSYKLVQYCTVCGEGEKETGSGTIPKLQSETKFTVTYDGNGADSGYAPVDTAKYAPNAAVTALGKETLGKTGYTFAGWSEDPNADTGDVAVGSSFTIKHDTTLYAIWKQITYTVEFNANGGSGTMSSQPFNYDEEKSLSKNTFTRDPEGKKTYDFAGWALKSDGAVKYADKATVKNLANTPGATVKLYAQWTEVTDYNVVDTITTDTSNIIITAKADSTVKQESDNKVVVIFNKDEAEKSEVTITLKSTDDATVDGKKVTIGDTGSSFDINFKKTIEVVPKEDEKTEKVVSVDIAFDIQNMNAGNINDRKILNDLPKLGEGAKKAVESLVASNMKVAAVSTGTVKPETNEILKEKGIKVTFTLDKEWVEKRCGEDLEDIKKNLLCCHANESESTYTTLKDCDIQEQDNKYVITATSYLGFSDYFVLAPKAKITVTYMSEGKAVDGMGGDAREGDIIDASVLTAIQAVKPAGKHLVGLYTDSGFSTEATFPYETGDDSVIFHAKWEANPTPGPEPDPEKPTYTSSSRNDGYSIWLPATAEPTPTQTPAVEPTQAVPTASPVKPTQSPATPAPFIGLLAGLGAAAVFFGLRRR